MVLRNKEYFTEQQLETMVEEISDAEYHSGYESADDDGEVDARRLIERGVTDAAHESDSEESAESSDDDHSKNPGGINTCISTNNQVVWCQDPILLYHGRQVRHNILLERSSPTRFGNYEMDTPAFLLLWAWIREKLEKTGCQRIVEIYWTFYAYM
ncbi:hypothetical protein QE152_g5290 [Popillia japonica]|uniref:Uncharacterized protein n=1 Tax=Popillia japonica TaxID=7064 RepID=A0AAW1MP13_POPJA